MPKQFFQLQRRSAERCRHVTGCVYRRDRQHQYICFQCIREFCVRSLQGRQHFLRNSNHFNSMLRLLSKRLCRINLPQVSAGNDNGLWLFHDILRFLLRSNCKLRTRSACVPCVVFDSGMHIGRFHSYFRHASSLTNNICILLHLVRQPQTT